jgi:hypothetical protein
MRSTLTTPGRTFRFRQQEFWADQGMIHILDYRNSPYNPFYRSIGVEELVELIKAFQLMLPRFKYPDERDEHERLVQNLMSVGCAAKAQGDPHDEKVSQHYSRKY